MALHRADVIQALNMNAEDAQSRIDDKVSYKWRFLAEGDSWFTIGSIPSSSLLYELRLKKPAVLLNLGYPGDTIANISQLSANTEFSRRLADPRWASDWDAILMSAGGNDLIDQADQVIVQSPAADGPIEDCFHPDALQALRSGIEAGYRRVVALRDSPGSPSRGKPILVHTYDYPTPRPAPAQFIFVPLTRPWLLPAFERCQVPETRHLEVADFLLDRLADTLLGLERELPDFFVTDTRRTLQRARPNARGNSGDWLNEIHPNSGGYRKVAARLSEALHQILL